MVLEISMTHVRHSCLVNSLLDAGSRIGGRQRGEQAPQLPPGDQVDSGIPSMGRKEEQAERSGKSAWDADADEAAGGWGSKQAREKHNGWD